MWTDGGKKVQLYDLTKGKKLGVLIHLVCPNIMWLNQNKGEMFIDPFKDAIFSAVRQVCKQDMLSGFDSETLTSFTIKVMDAYPTLSFTLRQIFYQLVANYSYLNTKQSYNKLGKALVNARQEESVDADKIV